MPDREAVVQRLTELNEEFRRLRAEHQAHEQELAELQARPFLSAEQQWRESELKKLKLIGKDRMETLIRQNQAAASMSACGRRPSPPMPRATAGRRARAGRGLSRSRHPKTRRRPSLESDPGVGLAGLSHVDRRGKARMVDVSTKPDTVREARARVTLRLRPATLRAIQRGEVVKGDVLGVARLAGIMAAKRTPELIPLCHPLR